MIGHDSMPKSSKQPTMKGEKIPNQCELDNDWTIIVFFARSLE